MRILLSILLLVLAIKLPSTQKEQAFVVAWLPDWYNVQEYFVVDRVDTLSSNYVRLYYKTKIIGDVSPYSLKKVKL